MQESEMLSNEYTFGFRVHVACEITNITYRQIDYWARTSLVAPSIRNATGSGSQRLYSFKDILVLKVVKSLLDAGISLRNSRLAAELIRSRDMRTLAQMTLISDGNAMYECMTHEDVIAVIDRGRAVFAFALTETMHELINIVASLPTTPGGNQRYAKALLEPTDPLI
nr:MerR family transcriptional regulator [Rhodococcus erythropolis]